MFYLDKTKQCATYRNMLPLSLTKRETDRQTDIKSIRYLFALITCAVFINYHKQCTLVMLNSAAPASAAKWIDL